MTVYELQKGRKEGDGGCEVVGRAMKSTRDGVVSRQCMRCRKEERMGREDVRY